MPLAAEHAGRLAELRKGVRRARGQGRRWFLRAGVMLAIAWWAYWRGGSVNLAVGMAMVVLAILAVSIGRSQRRQATNAETKIRLMEEGGAVEPTDAHADGRTA